MIKALILAYKRHAIYRATYKELQQLSDRELRDLGINRSDIECVAREATYEHEDKKAEKNAFVDMFKVKSEKDRIDEYLADAANIVDLENRIRNIDRGNAPWQIRGKNIAQGWMA